MAPLPEAPPWEGFDGACGRELRLCSLRALAFLPGDPFGFGGLRACERFEVPHLEFGKLPSVFKLQVGPLDFGAQSGSPTSGIEGLRRETFTEGERQALWRGRQERPLTAAGEIH